MESKALNVKIFLSDRILVKRLFAGIVVFIAGTWAPYALNSIPPLKSVLLFFTGAVCWTFIEYLLIRHAFHLPGGGNLLVKVLHDHHRRHHLEPVAPAYLFFPVVPGVFLFLVAALLLYRLFSYYSLSLMAGILAGYLVFSMVHYLVHFYPSPDFAWFKRLWQNHFLHHRLYPHKGYGVTTGVWDRIFGTAPPEHQFLSIVPSGNEVYRVAEGLRLIEVTDRETRRLFHSVQKYVYQRNRTWFPPIEAEIENIFDPERNVYFTHGAARRWIAVNRHQEVVGRIAAFVDFDKMYEEAGKTGSIGFFECVHNKEVAFFLFEQAIGWLKQMYGIAQVRGPVNFGENDRYWGLLVEGYGKLSYGMNYNPYYYRSFFEAYGFRPEYTQLTNRVDLTKPLPERFVRIACRVAGNERFSFVHYNKKNKEQFIHAFAEVYNQAWATFKNFRPISPEYVRRSLNELAPIIAEEFIWFAYAGGKPAGMLIAIPDVSPLLRYARGKFNLWGKLSFLLLKSLKGMSSVRVVIMGIVPEYQRHGLESALTFHAFQRGKEKSRYKSVELAWVGDFNPKMIAIHEAMGAVPDKKHITYLKTV